MENIEIYRDISNSDGSIAEEIKQILNDDYFVIEVLAEIELQDPICKLINVCQAKKTSIADGAELWIDLIIPTHLSNSQQKIYCKRKEMALSDVAVAAFYLDPFKDKHKLSRTQKKDARQFILSKLGTRFQDELLAYESENNLLLMNKIDNRKDFWTFSEIQMPNLSRIATKLHRIPASTAQLERVFSMWQHIHSQLRNRLTFARSKKLMHIYYFLNQTELFSTYNINSETFE